jgi:hypothetical protein
MMRRICLILLLATFLPAQSGETFRGVLTDDMCPVGDHSKMRMGSNDAECAIACKSSHGAAYVLYDGKEMYALSDQKLAEKFAGKKVNVTGSLDPKTKTIQVRSIDAAK